MYGVKPLMTLVTAGSLILGAGMALASTKAAVGPGETKSTATPAMSKAEVHRVRGEVTAVEPSAAPMTLTMRTKEGKEELTVGVDVTDKTMIREGKAHKTLADIKAGDRVWMKYERTDGKLVAEYIRILKPPMKAAAKKSDEPATSAASKSEGAQKSY
jgi:Cu/Ag efflux protein CusF